MAIRTVLMMAPYWAVAAIYLCTNLARSDASVLVVLGLGHFRRIREPRSRHLRKSDRNTIGHTEAAECPSDSDCSSGTSTTGTDTDSSSDTVTSVDSRPRRKSRHRKRRRSGHRLSAQTKVKLKKLSVPCCPPISTRYAVKIARGEYNSFDKLAITKIHKDKH